VSKRIDVDGVEVELRKHHFSKQLRLSIRGGKAMVTMPRRASYRVAAQFARSKSAWIVRQAAQSTVLSPPTTPQRNQARELLLRKLEQWSPEMGVEWQRLRIGNQLSRWGSCSSSGTLSFNWRAMYLPEQLLDYLVIHELAHVEHPNHSPQFWELVERYDVRFKQSRKNLKQIDFTEIEG